MLKIKLLLTKLEWIGMNWLSLDCIGLARDLSSYADSFNANSKLEGWHSSGLQTLRRSFVELDFLLTSMPILQVARPMAMFVFMSL